MRESYTSETCITKWGRRSGRYGAARLGPDRAWPLLIWHSFASLLGIHVCLRKVKRCADLRGRRRASRCSPAPRGACLNRTRQVPRDSPVVTDRNTILTSGGARVMCALSSHSSLLQPRVNACLQLCIINFGGNVTHVVTHRYYCMAVAIQHRTAKRFKIFCTVVLYLNNKTNMANRTFDDRSNVVVSNIM